MKNKKAIEQLINDYELRMESEQTILKNANPTKLKEINKAKGRISVISQAIEDLQSLKSQLPEKEEWLHGPLQQCKNCETKQPPCPDCGCVGLHGCVGKRPHGLTDCKTKPAEPSEQVEIKKSKSYCTCGIGIEPYMEECPCCQDRIKRVD